MPERTYKDADENPQHDRRITDTGNFNTDQHMAAAFRTRFKHKGNPEGEDIETTPGDQLRGGEEFRTSMRRFIARIDRELLPEQAVMLKKLKAKFDREIGKTFDHYEDSKEGMPTWDQIAEKITPEMLDKANKMEEMGLEPEIVVVSPHQTRQQAVKSIDVHKIEGQTRNTYFEDEDNNNLWNGGNEYPAQRKWIVKIGTGVENVPDDTKIEGNNVERSSGWVGKFGKAGLNITNDLDTLLAQVKQALANGRKLDTGTVTVLNALGLTAESLVALGRWFYDRLFLDCAAPDDEYDSLRGRAEVMVGAF